MSPYGPVKTAHVSFEVKPGEANLIHLIVHRASDLWKAAGHPFDYDVAITLERDLTACHANGCRLRLQDLLEADEFIFIHDVAGINKHMDRTTGQIKDCFVPHFAEIAV